MNVSKEFGGPLVEDGTRKVKLLPLKPFAYTQSLIEKRAKMRNSTSSLHERVDWNLEELCFCYPGELLYPRPSEQDNFQINWTFHKPATAV